MEQADVDRALDRRPVSDEQAFRRVRLREAQPVDRDRRRRRADLHDVRPGAEGRDAFGQNQFLGDPGQMVVIAADDERGDTGVVETF